MSLYRLNSSTVVEPLVHGWSANSQCVSPLMAALTVSHYQLPNLRQYLSAPEANVEACRNPKLRAGRFVNIAVERVPEVRALVASMECEYADSLRLATQLMQFQNTLVAGAKTGLPMAPFYAKLPPELRGYVELVYDYFTRPGVRVIEPLLYRSPYYKPQLQSLRLFGLKQDCDRDFVFSTPRLPSPGEIHWALPFDDARVDALFRLDSEPRPLEEIRELLGLAPAQDAVLRSLLTPAERTLKPTWDGPSPRVRHFGHACVLVEWRGTSILIDPCMGVQPSEAEPGRPGFESLPDRIDYAIVTHNHHDHFSIETLLRLRHKLGCLVVPRAGGLHYGDTSLKLLAQRIGFANVVELDTLDRIAIPDGEIVAVPFLGEHSDLPHAKAAYVVRTDARQMLFAADSDCLDVRQYELLREILGPVHSVFLGLECVGAPMSWSSGALMPVKPTVQQDQSRRQHGSNAERGMKIVNALQAEQLFVYAMGLEPWFEWLLGLAYTPDAPQIHEMKRIIESAKQAGLREARLLTASVVETVGVF